MSFTCSLGSNFWITEGFCIAKQIRISAFAKKILTSGPASRRNTWHPFCCKYQQILAVKTAEQKISDKKRFWTNTSLVSLQHFTGSQGFQVLGPWGSSAMQVGTRQSSSNCEVAQLPPLQLIRPTATNLGSLFSSRVEYRTANCNFKKQIFYLHLLPRRCRATSPDSPQTRNFNFKPGAGWKDWSLLVLQKRNANSHLFPKPAKHTPFGQGTLPGPFLLRKKYIYFF